MIGTSCNCVDICAMPLNSCMVPSVIRNEGTRRPDDQQAVEQARADAGQEARRRCPPGARNGGAPAP